MNSETYNPTYSPSLFVPAVLLVRESFFKERQASLFQQMTSNKWFSMENLIALQEILHSTYDQQLN